MNTRWRTYFSNVAKATGKMSKDTTKVGAVLVGSSKEILLTAYNGPPLGVVDKYDRFERPRKYLFASHAEQNIVAFAAKNGIPTEGKTLFVTHFPCSSCARSIIQAGIKTLWCGGGTTSMPSDEFEAAREMFQEAGVEVNEHS